MVSGRSGNSWGIALLLFCSLEGLPVWPVGWWFPSLLVPGFGTGYLGGHLAHWGWSWLSPFLFLLSFFFIFRALWFGLGLSFDWSFPLRVHLFCDDSIFVLHIFNKLTKNKKENPILFVTKNLLYKCYLQTL